MQWEDHESPATDTHKAQGIDEPYTFNNNSLNGSQCEAFLEDV